MYQYYTKKLRRQRQETKDRLEMGWAGIWVGHQKARQRTSHTSRMKSMMDDPSNCRTRKNTLNVAKEMRESAEAILQVSEDNFIT